MTTFYLIRHGERDTATDMLPGSAAGIHLTERGRTQAAAIARRLGGEPIGQVFSSPLERANETAEPLARARRLPIQIASALAEIDFGAWTGKAVPELRGDAEWEQFNRFRSGTRIPRGESAVEVQGRMAGELIRLRDSFPEQTIACVGHADPIRMALVYFLGMPVDFFARLEISVGSITTLELADWGARVIRLNEVPS